MTTKKRVNIESRMEVRLEVETALRGLFITLMKRETVETGIVGEGGCFWRILNFQTEEQMVLGMCLTFYMSNMTMTVQQEYSAKDSDPAYSGQSRKLATCPLGRTWSSTVHPPSYGSPAPSLTPSRTHRVIVF